MPANWRPYVSYPTDKSYCHQARTVKQSKAAQTHRDWQGKVIQGHPTTNEAVQLVCLFENYPNDIPMQLESIVMMDPQ